MRLCVLLADLLLQIFWGDLLTYNISDDNVIATSCFSAAVQLQYPSSVTIDPEAENNYKNTVENNKRKLFYTIILNLIFLRNFQVFTGEKNIKTHLLMSIHINITLLEDMYALMQLPNYRATEIVKITVLHLMCAYVHGCQVSLTNVLTAATTK